MLPQEFKLGKKSLQLERGYSGDRAESGPK